MRKIPKFYLEEVNIEGFKSFSQKTEMGFQPGIGVIIGNNGVGKSNILDAIVWAFGEDDLAQLRCRNEDELFFSGSKENAPASHLNVELVLRKGEEGKSPTLTLSRQKMRNGGESYRIDGEELDRSRFDKKLDKEHFTHALKSIIRQEQINDLLLWKPVRRYRWIHGQLSLDGATDISDRLQEAVSPLFRQYLDCLVPESNGQLLLVRQNGHLGLEIEITLPGNRRRQAHQLSGGEKAITSLAVKLAVFSQYKSPLYLLDEVEPALDYTNHKSMQALLKKIAADRQLIMITHLRSTVELAHTVHGVRTRRDGSSFMKFYFVMDERLLRLYKCC